MLVNSALRGITQNVCFHQCKFTKLAVKLAIASGRGVCNLGLKSWLNEKVLMR